MATNSASVLKLLFVVQVFALLPPAGAVDYFVRTDGNDSRCTGQINAADTGSGSAQACAWKTVDKCSTTITAGDRCRIQPGTYSLSQSMSAPTNSGHSKSVGTGAGCSCVNGSSNITCNNAGTVAAGDWVRCQSSDPYFDWTRVASKNGNTLTLDEGYRGVTVSSAALDSASFVEYIGDGPKDSVVLSHLQPKPAAVTFTQSSKHPKVWSFPKSQGSGSWANPSGFSAQGSGAWDKWFANRSGLDTFIKLNVTGANADRCPCGVTTATTCEDHVNFVPGSWCDDGTNIWMQTWDGRSPAVVDVQASNIPLGTVNWNIAGKDYLAVRNIYFKIHPNNNGGTASGGNSTLFAAAMRFGGNRQLITGVTAEGGACQHDFTGGKTQQQFEHMKCLDKMSGVDADSTLSGTRFLDVEVRGGYSNGWSSNYFRGTSTTDRLIVDGLYLHRVFTWYRSTECVNDNTFNCSTGAFNGHTAQAGAHGADIGAANVDHQIQHVLVQNSIIETTGDGLALWNGTNEDLLIRNNTFGYSGSTEANWRQEVFEYGIGSSSPKLELYNNVFLVDDITGGNWNASVVSYSGDWSKTTASNNMYLMPYNASANLATWANLWVGQGSLQDYSFEGAINTLGQEQNSFFVCYSGCSATGAGSTRVINNVNSRNYFVKATTSDGTASNYTPTTNNVGVNAGLNSQCPATDFYGHPRTDGACDIGAVEYQSGDTMPPAAPSNLRAN